MKPLIQLCSLAILFTSLALLAAELQPSPNGITLPSNYKNWRVLSISHRDDNQTLRVILGNDKAIVAARTGKTKPWPDGSILAKIVWKDSTHPNWEKAIVPGELVHAEFMVKNSTRRKNTGGWGFARWTGADQKPFGKDASFAQECFACHQPVKDNDYVFTKPAVIP